MARAFITFENFRTGQIRQAPVGFSWTTFFFGPIPAVMRGHWTVAAALALLSLAFFCIPGMIFAFFYNRMYVQHLIQEGYKATDSTQDLAILEKALSMRVPSAK